MPLIDRLEASNGTDAVPPLAYGEVTPTCPCCDRPSDTPNPIIGFDYWKGLVFKGDTSIRLQPLEADLLKILLDNWPVVTSKEKVLSGLYGRNHIGRKYSDKLNVLMSKLRRKLQTFDIKIQNIKRRGWILTKSVSSLCEGCFTNLPDPPSKFCLGCQAYQEHQQ